MTSNRKQKLGLAMLVTGVIGGVLIHQADVREPETPDRVSLGTTASTKVSPDSAPDGLDRGDTAVAPADQQQAAGSGPEPRYTFDASADYEAVSAYGELPHHLQDIRLPSLDYDEQGNLIVNSKIKDLIETLLTSSDSGGRQQAIARVEEYMTMTLPQPAASQAREVLQGYMDYKNALSQIELPKRSDLGRGAVLEQFEQAMAARDQLRREHLPDGVADAFFPDEAYDKFSVQRLTVQADPNLSHEQKQQRIREHEEALPERIRDRVREKRLQEDVERTVSDLKEEGGYDREIYELRRDFYGKETADRLTYFEDDSAGWQQRVSLFNQERAQIEQQQHLSASEKQARIEAMKDSTFTHKEQVKLAVQSVSEQAAQVD